MQAEGRELTLRADRVGGDQPDLEQRLDQHPQDVEIGEMDHAPVGEQAPVAVDHAAEEQAREQEEVGDPERLGEGHDRMHEALAPERLAGAERRMHHHDEDDAQALGDIDPGQSGRFLGMRAEGLRGASHGNPGLVIGRTIRDPDGTRLTRPRRRTGCWRCG